MPTQPQSLCSHVDLPHHPFKQSLVSCKRTHLFSLSFSCHQPDEVIARPNSSPSPPQPISPSRSLNSVKSSQHEASFLFNNHQSPGSREAFYTRSTSNMELLCQMTNFLPEPKYKKYFLCVQYISFHFKFCHSFIILSILLCWLNCERKNKLISFQMNSHRYSEVAKQELVNSFAMNTVSENTDGPSQIQQV